MVEILAGHGRQSESIRQRPNRIANRFLRCNYWTDVAAFYAEELGDISPNSLFQRKFSELSAVEKSQLRQEVRDRFAQLVTNGIISPEALTRSCTRIPPVSHWVSPEEESQRMEEPFFALTLKRYIPKDSVMADGAPVVLSLACGVDAEARAIHRHFAPEGEKNSVHVGIDRNNSNIESARRLYKENPGYTFIEGDLDSEEVRRQLEDVHPEFDVIMMRHFPVLPEGELWRRTLKKYARFLKSEGLLVMTLYYPEEFEIVSQNGLPDEYTVEVAERNRARSFNKRLFNQVMIHEAFGALASALSDQPQQEQYADVVENVFQQDQFIILAKKK